MLKRLTNRGDTLIEVALALAILSVVLAAAYAVTGKAAQLGQSAKERSEAVALAQQQAEIIEAYALRDWDSFSEAVINDGPAETVAGHFNPANWQPMAGVLAFPDTGPNYQISYTHDAECPVGCQPDEVTQITFTVLARWTPVASQPTQATTTLVVKVSPSGVNE